MVEDIELARLRKNKNIADAKRKPDKYFIDKFMSTGVFHKQDTFVRNFKNTDSRGSFIYWDVSCHKCSSDEFVLSGVCSGIFTTPVSTLLKGNKSCRCSKYYRYTKEQKEFQINKRCVEEGLTFIGWSDEYKDSRSYFKWVCKEGHARETRVNSFISEDRRCRVCSNLSGTANGYYSEKKFEVDYLYITTVTGSIKIGRSFNVNERHYQIKLLAGVTTQPTPDNTYTGTHEIIYNLEQHIHKVLRKQKLQMQYSWTNECFHKDSSKIIYEIIQEYITKGIIKQC